MRQICEDCPLRGSCAQLRYGRARDCIQVQTWDDGYGQAVEDAVAWLTRWCDDMSVLDGHDIETFRQYMEERHED